MLLYALTTGSLLPLLSLPVIWLGRACASPNINLADGCLPQIVLLFALGLGLWLGSTWFAVGLACWLTWLVTSVWMGLDAERCASSDAHSGPK